MGSVVGARAGHRDRVLAVLISLWLVVAPLVALAALRSDWPASGELPTADQVRHARSMAWVAGIVAVCPPAAGLVLARRWQSAGWTVTFLVGLTAAVLAAGVLLRLTGSPVQA